jgi:hypothetical protein
MPLRRKRDQTDEKMLILEDYESIFEGVSLHELPSIVGVSLTFAIVDEAAFVDKIMWDRGVQPPLTDQDGQAMLLSNYFGDENWFTELAETAEADAEHRIWSIHKGTSWTNFYSYPQGRNTPSLKVVEETTDPWSSWSSMGATGLPRPSDLPRVSRPRPRPTDPDLRPEPRGDPRGGPFGGRWALRGGGDPGLRDRTHSSTSITRTE